MSAPQSIFIQGIQCFAPEFAESCDDYPKEIYAELAKIEEKHFWFRSRNVVIRLLLEKYLPAIDAGRFLEIGCGTGYVLNMLASMPGLNCAGAEIHLRGATMAKARVPSAEIIQMDATAIPFEDTFDGIGAFDVIEHIEDDEAVLRNVHRALKSGGCFFLTVPQHPFLWSYQDQFAGHKRRYTRSDLMAKLTRNGFSVEYAGSFCCALFPLMLLIRLIKGAPAKGANLTEVLAEFRISATLNRLLRTLMRFDEALIRRGASLPFGGSLVAVGRKCPA